MHLLKYRAEEGGLLRSGGSRTYLRRFREVGARVIVDDSSGGRRKAILVRENGTRRGKYYNSCGSKLLDPICRLDGLEHM